MGVFSFVGKVGAAATKAPQRKIPDFKEYAGYQPSKYDEPSAAQLHKTYSSRAAGEGVGFSQADLGQMRGRAIDEAQRVGGELERRGMAGRRLGGGVTTGGTARLREKGILATQLARSQSLRDIAIRNAVLKRTETWEGVLGLDKFLQSERADAYQKTRFSREKTQYGNLLSQEKSRLEYGNQLNKYQKTLERWGLFGEFESDIVDPFMEAGMAAATGGASIPATRAKAAAKSKSKADPYDYAQAYQGSGLTPRSRSNYRRPYGT